MTKILLFIAAAIISFSSAFAQTDITSIKTAESYFNNKEWDKAIDAYKTLIQKDRYNGSYYTTLAEIYYNTKNYKESIKNYEEAIKVGYASESSAYNIACCYALMGDAENAVKWLKTTGKLKFKNLDEKVKKDSDFDKIKNDEIFKTYLARTVDKSSGRTEVWKADIMFLKERMEQTHYNIYEVLTKEKWDNSFSNLLDNIESLDDEHINTELAKIIASVGDGHTILFPAPKNGNKQEEYKIKFYKFKDGLYIKGITKDYAQYNGMKVTSIGKYKTEDALKKISEIIPHDNELGIDWLTPNYLMNNDYLYGLGINDSKDVLKLELEDNTGKKMTAEIKKSVSDYSAGFHGQKNDEYVYANESSTAPLPLYLKRGNEMFWFEHLTDLNFVYMQVNGISNNGSEKIKDFYDKVFKFIDSNNVEGIIIDLRLNGGGNNFLNKHLINNFIRYDKINKKGKVFTIIGRNTFSAAMNLVGDLENSTQTIFIGEPTGSRPNFAGEINFIELPNTGIKVSASSMYWQKSVSSDKRKWVFPEVYTPLSFSDYKNNIDPAMNAVYDYISYLKNAH